MKPLSKKDQAGRYHREKPAKSTWTMPEHVLQKMCEQYLETVHLKYIRVPDFLYTLAFGKNSILEEWQKKFVAKYITGQCDLVLLSTDGRFLAIELKKDGGKVSQGQEIWKRGIEDHWCVIADFEIFQATVDRFRK